MKNENEELIQQLIERQLKGLDDDHCQPDNQEDAKVYEILFRELSDAPYLPNDFTLEDDVIKEISKKQEKAESVKYAVVIFTISFIFLLLTCLSVMVVKPAFIQTAFSKITTHSEIYLFIVLSLTVIQAIDKIFVKPDFSGKKDDRFFT